MKERAVDIGTAVFICLLSLFLMRQLEGVPREGVLLPNVILWALIACAALMAVRAFFLPRDAVLPFFGDLNIRHFGFVICVFLASVFCALYVSFFLTIFFMSLSVTVFLTAERTKTAMALNLLFSAGVVAFFYLFFTRLMHINFPEPLLS